MTGSRHHCCAFPIRHQSCRTPISTLALLIPTTSEGGHRGSQAQSLHKSSGSWAHAHVRTFLDVFARGTFAEDLSEPPLQRLRLRRLALVAAAWGIHGGRPSRDRAARAPHQGRPGSGTGTKVAGEASGILIVGRWLEVGQTAAETRKNGRSSGDGRGGVWGGMRPERRSDVGEGGATGRGLPPLSLCASCVSLLWCACVCEHISFVKWRGGAFTFGPLRKNKILSLDRTEQFTYI